MLKLLFVSKDHNRVDEVNLVRSGRIQTPRDSMAELSGRLRPRDHITSRNPAKAYKAWFRSSKIGMPIEKRTSELLTQIQSQ